VLAEDDISKGRLEDSKELVARAQELIKTYTKEAKGLDIQGKTKAILETQPSTNLIDNKNLDKYVFISLSMPEQGLKELLIGAKEKEFVPVLRGFKNDSYKETVKALEALIKETGYGVIVEPDLYRTFEINVVPTYVISEKKEICPPNSSCIAPKYKKLSGNVTAEFAYKKLLGKGGNT
jgi:conjugal transfer pilus assembly protein TrbC